MELSLPFSICVCSPLQRDEDEVKQLSHHLSHFPGLLPDMSPPVLHGSAARSLLESVPKGGFSCTRVAIHVQLHYCRFMHGSTKCHN